MATLIKFRIGGGDDWLRGKIRALGLPDPPVQRVIVEDEMWRETHEALAAYCHARKISYGGCEALNVEYATKDRDGYEMAQRDPMRI